jgi:hypothetical protein
MSLRFQPQPNARDRLRYGPSLAGVNLGLGRASYSGVTCPSKPERGAVSAAETPSPGRALPHAGADQEQSADDRDAAHPRGHDSLLFGRDLQVPDSHHAPLGAEAETSREDDHGAKHGQHDSNNDDGLHTMAHYPTR